MKKNKTKVYSKLKRKATPQEIEYYNKAIEKEMKRHEESLNCGGIGDNGCYCRLHDRRSVY